MEWTVGGREGGREGGRTYHPETPLAAAEAAMEEKAVAVIISQHRKS